MTALIARDRIDTSKADTPNGVSEANFALGAGNAWDCIQTLGVGVSSITANAVLTQANAGMLQIDASAGNIAITLPACSAAVGALYQFKRLDATANTVTINRAGGDTIDGATAITLIEVLDFVEIRSDGVSAWRALNNTVVATKEVTTAGTDIAYAIAPAPALNAYRAGRSYWVKFHAASGLNPTLQISGLATPPNLVMQKADGTYINAVGIPLNHRSLVTLLSATQALVVTMPPVPAAGLECLHVRDEKPSATDAGASVIGNQTRTLNTVVTNTITGASLAANAVTLPAGTYRIFASAPAVKSLAHRVRLLNTTDAAVALLGTSEYTALSSIQTRSIIEGRIVIAATKTFNLQHFIAADQTLFGLGVSTADTFVSVYATLMIWKE